MPLSVARTRTHAARLHRTQPRPAHATGTSAAQDTPLAPIDVSGVRARSIGTRARSLVDARLDVLRTYGSQRATHVELDHKALQGNVGAVRAKVGARTEICAVVKGNAYGHGAVDVARTVLAAGADRLAVATVAEAVELRRAGIDAPVLVLGATTPAEAEAIVACDITATVTNAETALALATAARKLGSTARVHLKVNTGMNRLGVRPDEAPALLERLRAMKGVHVEGIFTHFHSADVDLAVTRAQLASFTALLETLTARGLRPKIAHAAASDALLALPESHLDMVRPGTALYGMVPGVGQKVLSWKTSIAHVNELKAGETVSYGATWTAPDARRVAVIPVGWSDGLQAGASRFKEVLVGGVRCPIVGSITMDQAMVDVTAVPNAGVGDEVVLIGGQGRGRRRVETTVEEAAKWLGDVHPVNVTTNIRRVPVVPSDSAALATWTFARVEPTSVPRSRGHVVRSARSP